MAEIKLENLHTHSIVGDELFNDSESFMIELNDECTGILGGKEPICAGVTCDITHIHCVDHSNVRIKHID
jgi:hypothetical protein